MADRRRAAVLGSPIAHSLSPALHRAAYASLGLDWTYDAVDVDETALPDFLASLDDTWAGLSLTMPLKETVLPLLASIDPVAARVRAVNTLLPAEARGWHGTNTDIGGMVDALTRAGLGRPATGTVLGAGATARSAVAAFALLGVARAVIVARRPEAAADVAEVAESLGLAAVVAPWEQPHLEADVVISALPGAVASSWSDEARVTTGGLLDVSYDPWPSALAASWGGPVIASGRDLLLWQAVEQVRLMTGRDPDVAAMARAIGD